VLVFLAHALLQVDEVYEKYHPEKQEFYIVGGAWT
jgi:hypothetical protein